jgi:thiamine biosynthesis protein ThiI
LQSNDREVLLIRFGEIHLKGLNRPFFMNKLVGQIREAARALHGEAWMSDGHMYVGGASDMKECIRKVSRVFGIHSLSPAWETEKDFETISARALDLVKNRSGSFKVKARRSDKRFPIDSQEINRELGGRILDANPQLRVDVVNPDWTLSVEIRDRAYLYVEVIPGLGGMPRGVGGRACLLLSGGIDSPVAGFQIARRGVSLCAVYFDGFPYTSERAKEKVVSLARILSESCGSIRLYAVPFAPVQQAIRANCPELLTTVLMRRFMMRIAERIARSEGASALITGESIGQVASQTMDALVCTDAAAEMPVFRPLIGLDKLDIIRMAETIGTYAVSILPYEDCCSIFTPKHPATHPKLGAIETAETKLDINELVRCAAESAQRMTVRWAEDDVDGMAAADFSE